MSKAKKDTIEAKGFAIQIYTEDFKNDYISLTDIARYKSDEPSDVIKNWMRRKDTIEFLGLWESLNNMNFNSVEFDRIESKAGYNSFTLSPKKWGEKTGAIGIISKGGRYSGAFAHTNIAFEFASWISAEFKMLIDLYKEKSLVKHLMEVQKRAIDFMRQEKPNMMEAWKIESETSPEYKVMISALKEMAIKEIVEA